MRIISICARGGSSGVPDKNIRLVCGKPLIAWTIDQALSSRVADGVFVSTDDERIAQVARDCGAEVPFIRPRHLATATAPKLPVIEHLVDWVDANVGSVSQIIDLPPTSPLREIDDIRTCQAMLDEATDLVITGYESDKNPYFNMIERKATGYYERVCPSAMDVPARQLAPKVYAMNGAVYVWHRHTLSPSLWTSERIRLHVMPRERLVDIDDQVDLELVELLMRKRGLT